MTIANYLTLARLFVSPIFLWVYLGYESLQISQTALPYVLLMLLAISEISDFSDGYFARKYNQVTELGKILDPMADSITRISVFLAFTQPPIQLPIVWVFLLLYRDSVVSTLRTVCALHGFTLSARRSGKIKAVLQGMSAIVILMLMIPYTQGTMSLETLQQASEKIVAIACAYTLYSGVEYIFANRQFVAKLTSLGTQQSGN